MNLTACPVCEETRWEELREETLIHPTWFRRPEQDLLLKCHYRVCRTCGYVRFETGLSFDDYVEYYRSCPVSSRESYAARRPLYEERRDFVRSAIGAIEDYRIVDVGSAYGDQLLYFDGARELIGIEPAEEHTKALATTAAPIRHLPFTIEQVLEKFPDLVGSADLVLSSHTLEHIWDPNAFVRSLAAMSRAGGYLYLEVPSLEAMAECRQSAYQTLHFGHISHFSIPPLLRLLQKHGYFPVKVDYTTKRDYPALRALCRKHPGDHHAREHFMKHSADVTAGAEAGARLLADALREPAFHAVVIWGCGQDMVDVVSRVPKTLLTGRANALTLVDINSEKQGRKLFGLTIQSPEALRDRPIDVIFSSTRSQMIHADILQSVGRLVPNHRGSVLSFYHLLDADPAAGR